MKRIFLKLSYFLLISVAYSIAFPNSAFAVIDGDYQNFNGGVNHNWNTPGNWQKRVAGAWVTGVDYPSSVTGNTITYTGATWSLSINAAVTLGSGTVLNATGPLTVGSVAAGVLTLNSGSSFNITSGTITINAQSGSTLVVNSGASVNISSGAILSATNNPNSGIYSVSVTGTIFNDGTLTFGGTATRTNCMIINSGGKLALTNNGGYTGTAAGKLIVANGGTYDIQCTTVAGSVPAATWQTGSTCLISGYTTNTSVPTGLSTPTLYNFTWNTPNIAVGTYFDLNGQVKQLASGGTFTVSNTGASNWLVWQGTVASAVSGTIADNIVINGGTSDFALTDMVNSGSINMTCTNLTISGGSTFDLVTNAASTAGSSNLNISGTFSTTSSDFLVNNSGGTTGTITFTGGSQTYSNNVPSGNYIGAVNFSVGGSTTLTMGTAITGGTGSFTASSGSTIKLGSVDASGVIQSARTGGNFQNSGTLTFTGCNIELNGASAQVFGDAFPTGVNVSINNASGVSLSGSYVCSGTLNFTSGKLVIGANTLTLNGNVGNTGAMSGSKYFTCSTSSNITIGYTSTFSSSLYFDAAANTINNLTVSGVGGSSTLGNALKIKNIVSITAGTLNTGGNLTLISDASATACIGSVGGAISGSVTVQRYITNPGGTKARFRFLAAPVTGQSIHLGWQSTIYITGDAGDANTTPGQTTTNGFDATATNSSSMFTYNEAFGTWVGATSTSSNTTAGTGYRVYIRGTRTLNQINGTSITQDAPVTLAVTGSISTGNVNATVTKSGGGWNLVGNPYPCAYDWATQYNASAGIAGFANTLYIWDATSNSYKSWNATSGTGTLSSGIIPSGGSFFIQATSAPTMQFRETYKYTAGGGNAVFKSSTPSQLTIKFYSAANNNDEFVFGYMSGASKTADNLDVVKFTNPELNLSSYSTDNVKLNVSMFPPISSGIDTVNLNITAASSGTYSLIFSGVNSFPSNQTIYLVDNYTSSVLNLTSITNYPFSIDNTISASYGANRFMLLINNSGSSSLPISFAGFNANKVNLTQVKLDWSTKSELSSDRFEIQHSLNQNDFTTIGTVKAAGNSINENVYQFVHETPDMRKVNYYRLKMFDFDGSFTLSPVLSVDFNADVIVKNSHIDIYPVPANNQVSVTLQNTFKGDVTVKVFDLVGKLILSADGTISDPVQGVTQSLENVHSGVYVLEVSAKSGEFVERTKFVKE